MQKAKARTSSMRVSVEALNQVKRRAAWGVVYLKFSAGRLSVGCFVSATANEIVDEKGWELAAEINGVWSS